MKAIILKAFGGIENFEAVNIPVPAIKADEVLIKLKSISLNPVDAKTRQGKGAAGRTKMELPIILGWDISGVITEAGSEVTGFKSGDEVFSMINFPVLGKTYTEYVVAKPSELAIKPANITHNEAAAATLAALTAWQVLTTKVKVEKGDRVLVHAAAGGVGHYVVQMAKHLGAYVIGTSSAANKDFVLSLGADEHIDYKTQKIEEAVSDIDFIFDPIGGANTEQSLHIVNKGGAVICILHAFNDELLQKAKELGVHGHNVLVYPSGDDMKTIAGLLEKGIIKSHVSKVFQLEQVGEAHTLLESGRAVGKVVVEI
ncbi:NADP-dependent oxidoreductase [Mucilaginibacter sp. AW1-7]|uniref:NADP-dependent oxidoreductase n=1 Tax=Mucilaginibacter sp. AW1-7 TaxID=3349874 RepID=UPI003F73F613